MSARSKVVVVGCGSMSDTWISYAKERSATCQDVEIVALVDICLYVARAKAAAFGLRLPCFNDVGEAVVQTGANLVFDISIPASHREVTAAAFAHGCHVFGEKPMAATLEDAHWMASAAEASGLHYSVMQNRRYLKGIRAFRNLIAEHLGAVGIVNVDFYIGAHFGGFRDLMDSPLILDMAIHTFDMARFIAGCNPVSVYCKEFNPSWSWYAGASSATCVFCMENGAVFTYRGSWAAEGADTSWEGQWRVVGEHGTAVWNGNEAPSAQIITPMESKSAQMFHRESRALVAPMSWPGREGHYGCLDEMFAAIAECRPAETDCTDNVKSMEMVFGALESSRTGSVVML